MLRVSISLVQCEILCLFATPPVQYGDSAKLFYQFQQNWYTQIPAKHFPAFLQPHQDLHEHTQYSWGNMDPEGKCMLLTWAWRFSWRGEDFLKEHLQRARHCQHRMTASHRAQLGWEEEKVSRKAMDREICFFSFCPPLPCSSLG